MAKTFDQIIEENPNACGRTLWLLIHKEFDYVSNHEQELIETLRPKCSPACCAGSGCPVSGRVEVDGKI